MAIRPVPPDESSTANPQQQNVTDPEVSVASYEIPVRSPDHLLIRYSANYVLVGKAAHYFLGYELEVNGKRTL